MLECVVNVSEGRRHGLLHALAGAAGASLLDVHHDPWHNRAVLTLAGPDVEADVRALTAEAVARIDLRSHVGAHPRLGAVDVVPFVALDGSTFADALAARDRFSTWAGAQLAVPCFRYGPERTLPDVRRGAFRGLEPDDGPGAPHATAGAIAVGARPLLVAYNVWLVDADLDAARAIAAALRGPSLRTLALEVGDAVQVSFNLVDPDRAGPADAYDAVAARARVARAELVGLVPARVLDSIPASRWRDLDLSPARTIEARLREAGLDGGSAAPG